MLCLSSRPLNSLSGVWTLSTATLSECEAPSQRNRLYLPLKAVVNECVVEDGVLLRQQLHHLLCGNATEHRRSRVKLSPTVSRYLLRILGLHGDVLFHAVAPV
eukprot:gnl/TRDRNA2_/TRDRNA2_158442_c0_seq2.p1 gnl/TRDRNA2_/TRDRNA2_158442_c0~~gnl/TRDRNA2_/TRDRNA2_158442_c0_seq2.p1  ORF type:complete len:103 (-),score=0.77 gnl/TRDRNA2_/TRDRNA2_158442_c0_seq2:59-367(-)